MAMVYEPSGALEAVIALVIGLVIGMAGRRLALGLAGLFGFLAGFALGFMGGTLVGGPLVGLVLGLIAGVVFGLIAHFALRVVAAFLVGSLAATLALSLGLPMWMVVVAALAVGLLGLMAHEYVILVGTAVLGAVVAAPSALHLLARMGVGVGNAELAYLVGALALAVLGIGIQLRAMRRDG